MAKRFFTGLLLILTSVLVADAAPFVISQRIIKATPPVGTAFQPTGDYSNGLGIVEWEIEGSCYLNTNITTPLTLSKDGENTPIFSIKASDDIFSGAYCQTSPADGNTKISIYFSMWSPYTVSGTYKLSIPGGFFISSEDINCKPEELTYIMTDQAVDPVEKPKLKFKVSPEAGDVTEFPSTVRVTLTDHSQVVPSSGAKAVITGDNGFSQECNISSKEFGNTISIAVDPVITVPGDYIVTIPSAQLNDENAKMLADYADIKINYTLKTSTGPISFESIMKSCSLPVNTPFDAAEGEWSATGITQIKFVLDGDVNIDRTGEGSLTFTKEGESAPLYSIPAGKAEDDYSTPYVYMNKPNAGETIMQCLFKWGSDYTPGTYILSIPEGFLTVGGEAVGAAEFKFIVKDPNAKENISFESIMKSCNLPVNTPFDASEGDWSATGITQVKFVLDGDVNIDRTGEGSLTFTKEGESAPLYSIPAGKAEDDYSTPYVFMNKPNAGETIMQCLFKWGSDYTPGTYILSIPEGFLTVGGEAVGAAEFKFIVKNKVGIESVVDGDDVVDVYGIDGTVILRRASANDIRSLESGVYIIKGQKVLIK